MLRLALTGLSSCGAKDNTDIKRTIERDRCRSDFKCCPRHPRSFQTMGNSSTETELMHRALQEIEQMLSALETSARAHPCLPRDDIAALTFVPPGSRQQPGRS